MALMTSWSHSRLQTSLWVRYSPRSPAFQGDSLPSEPPGNEFINYTPIENKKFKLKKKKNQCGMGPCMLSRFSHAQFFATLWTVARRAPLSVGFSGQEYWSGLPFPPPGDGLDPGIEPMFSALQADSLPAEPLGPLQMLHEPREGDRAQYNLELLIKCGQGPGKEDCLSKVWPDGKESQSLSHSYRLLLLLLSHFSRVQLFVTLWTVAHQAPLSVGFSGQEKWSGLPCPSPEDLPDPGIEPDSLTSTCTGRWAHYD